MLSAENEQYRENLGVSNISSNCLLSFPIRSTYCKMTSTEDDDEVGHFILRFSSSPTSSSPPPPAAAAAAAAATTTTTTTTTTKTILIDQFLVIHAIAWLVVDEFDLLHLFLVINGLQEFVADWTDFNHDL
jgi:hypothetical protein